MPGKVHVTTTITGNRSSFCANLAQTILEVLRDQLDLTGTKEGCSNGNCGACSILVNGGVIDAC